MAKKKQPPKADQLTDQALALAEYAAKTLIAAEQLRIITKPVEGFPLVSAERAIAAELPALLGTLKKKLARKNTDFTVAETADIVMAVADSLLYREPVNRLALLFSAKKLADCLQSNVVPSVPAKSKKPKPTGAIYQFKITLLGVKPLIWRRIQVPECSLDKLHEHIQTSMGWTNSHVHQFKIGAKRYGDPMLVEEDFEEFGCEDSTSMMLSDILPKDGKRCRFVYEYDLGDSWNHGVLFEGCVQAEAGRKDPLCLEGERACPPEDCGGVGGYAEFLEAIQDKTHEEREAMFEWVSGWFDPEEFDATTATKSMKKGLPDWKTMD